MEAEEAREAERARLEEMFRQIDSDGSGTIDARELQEFALGLGLVWTLETCGELTARLDADRSGAVSRAEFARASARPRPPLSNAACLSGGILVRRHACPAAYLPRRILK